MFGLLWALLEYSKLFPIRSSACFLSYVLSCFVLCSESNMSAEAYEKHLFVESSKFSPPLTSVGGIAKRQRHMGSLC